MALALSAVLAQDGGVYLYQRAALQMPGGEILMVDAGIALDAEVAIARADELQRARADKAPSWVTAAAAVVASVVYAADQVRRWIQPP
jgi:hypothetical protein